MFASTPVPAPLPASLASHLFGRYLGRSSLPGAHESVVVPAPQALAADDDATPDLAQRVRDVGEW